MIIVVGLQVEVWSLFHLLNPGKLMMTVEMQQMLTIW